MTASSVPLAATRPTIAPRETALVATCGVSLVRSEYSAWAERPVTAVSAIAMRSLFLILAVGRFRPRSYLNRHPECDATVAGL